MDGWMDRCCFCPLQIQRIYGKTSICKGEFFFLFLSLFFLSFLVSLICLAFPMVSSEPDELRNDPFSVANNIVLSIFGCSGCIHIREGRDTPKKLLLNSAPLLYNSVFSLCVDDRREGHAHALPTKLDLYRGQTARLCTPLLLDMIKNRGESATQTVKRSSDVCAETGRFPTRDVRLSKSKTPLAAENTCNTLQIFLLLVS